MKPSQDFADYPKIDVVHLFPCAMTPLEVNTKTSGFTQKIIYALKYFKVKGIKLSKMSQECFIKLNLKISLN